jgi:T5SS/PEP-CTERM-associated repeat protein
MTDTSGVIDLTSTVTVTGAGSTWTNSGSVDVGFEKKAVLTIANGGVVTASDVGIAIATGSTGTLYIGAPSGLPAVAPGTLNTPSVMFGSPRCAAMLVGLDNEQAPR